jgi:tetratricopeptide (TPR) repeat protein
MRVLCLLAALAPTALLADCPALPARSDLHISLMEQVAAAPDEITAREISNQLWEIWGTAPDDTAQEILQRGMERRAGYDFSGALEDFDALIAYCPDYAEGYNQRAFVNFIQGDYETSLTDLDRAIARTPDHIGAIVGRALALIQLGRNEEGQTQLRAALELNPWLPERRFLTEPSEGPETEL